jgi:type II secretory pathway predicted ATPase ExeA
MYEQFYGLTERPFSLLPDPDFLYLSPQHKLARAYLEYGLTQKLGFVVLTGEIGTGKTTLIKSLLQAKEGKQRLGVLYQTSFGAEDLLELLLREFEIHGQFPTRAGRLAAFNQFLLQAYGRGEHVVLIVDEAQNLGPAALEELRLLSNIQSDKEPLLQVILVGQPDLRERLRHPSLRQLAQRVGVHFHLQPLDEEETKEYIHFRLARAGGSGIFTPSGLKKIFECTRGVPRRINTWCDLALVAGFAEGRQEIDGEFLETVLAAQGEALEGPDRLATGPEEGLSPASGAAELWPQGDHSTPHSRGPNDFAKESFGDLAGNHLRREVLELANRLSRLEGLVLELTSQLVPVIARSFSEQSVDTKSSSSDDQDASSPNPLLAPADEEISPPPSRKWWSRFFKP